MRHVNHLAGLGLSSAEFRDWWAYQPSTGIGVNVWDNDFERPNVFTIEQVQQLYYYFKSMVVTPPATRITQQWEYAKIHDNRYWPLTNDPSYDPDDQLFSGTTTTIGEWYDYCGGVPGSIRYFQAPQPPGSSDGDQPDGTWVQNGYWFNKVPEDPSDPSNPFFYRDPIFQSIPYNPQTWSYAYDPIYKDLPAGVGISQTPYTVEYNRTLRQRMRPVCIDNTWAYAYYSTGAGTPGNALNEELGNAGSGSWWENPNFVRFEENETVINSAPSIFNQNYKTTYEINTTIMGNIYFYCLGIDPSDNQIKWTISSQHPQYNVDTEIEGGSTFRPDFNTGRYKMGNWERNPYWYDPKYYFASRGCKTYFTEPLFPDLDYFTNPRNVLWIPDASCDINAMLEDDGNLNTFVKKIDVEVSEGTTITFLQEIMWYDQPYIWSPIGEDSNVTYDNVKRYLDIYTFSGARQEWSGFNYSANLTVWSWFEQVNDWTITNPTFGVRN